MDNQSPIPEEQLDEIERYLLQSMSPDEETSFRLRLNADQQLRQNTLEQQLLILGIQEARLEEKLGEFHKGILSTPLPQVPAGRVLRLRPWQIAAAAVLLILVPAWWIYFKSDSSKNIYARYYQPDAGLITAMSSSDNYLFDKAMIDYKTGNYSAAIRSWDSLLLSRPFNDTLHYFLGCAYLASNQEGKAITSFQKLKDGVFLKDAYWYQGLALIKQNKIEEAIPFIEKSDNPSKEELLATLKQRD